MFNFFDVLIQYIETIWQFVLTFIQSLLNFFGIIPFLTTLPQNLILYMPSIISTSILAVLTFAIVKILIGR